MNGSLSKVIWAVSLAYDKVLVTIQPIGGPRWFSPERVYHCVIPAKAGIQNFKAFDKTGLLPRAGMARGAIRLKGSSFGNSTDWTHFVLSSFIAESCAILPALQSVQCWPKVLTYLPAKGYNYLRNIAASSGSTMTKGYMGVSLCEELGGASTHRPRRSR